MRKNHLALSIAAMIGGFAGNASADAFSVGSTAGANSSSATGFAVTPAGVGHMLVLPYFTTQAGNSTLINLVNTDTTNAKAVKVRFRGASNSDDIFDFQVYMSPGDVWTANVSATADGRSQLSTSDKSCTLPSSVSQAFVTDRLPASYTQDQRYAETREGYVEIFNMADIPPKALTTAGVTTTAANALFTAVKHVSGVAPCTATTLGTLTQNPTDTLTAHTLGFQAPSTGLFGNYTIINVPATTTYSSELTAIVAESAPGVAGLGNIVFFPQTGTAATTVDAFTADPSLRTIGGAAANGVQNGAGTSVSNTLPIITAAFFDLPDLSTPYLSTTAPGNTAPLIQAQTLTQALAVKTITNEYITDSSISAKTDWVFSMPTRRYSVALDYATTPFTRVFSNFAAAVGAGNDFFTRTSTSLVNGQICVTADSQKLYDREETTANTGFVISPGTASAVSWCGETSVVSFNAGGATQPSALGAKLARKDIDGGSAYVQGWAVFGTAGPTVKQSGGPQAGGSGLPILGSAYLKATNPAVGAGVSGTFGGSWNHRYTK